MDELDSKIRVLVVDDSAVMRKIIISALEKEPNIDAVEQNKASFFDFGSVFFCLKFILVAPKLV